ncbi:hypothetical protein NU195Hw_g3801t1 [Hortaea werneckii]
MSPFRSGLTSSSSLLLAASARNKVKMRSFMSSPVRFQDPVHRYRDPQTRQFFLTFRRLAMAISTFLGLGLIYSYAPPFRTTTREGRAFDQYLQKDWANIEAKEGDLGRKETGKDRKQEQEYRASHQGQAKGDVP